MAVPPNKIRYPAGTGSNEIRSNNFGLGVKQYSKYGPTSISGYWNGITPPTGGYTIYADKSSQGPAIFTAGNDQNLIFFTKLLGGTSITDDATALSFIRSVNNFTCVNFDYPDVITNGLIYWMDSGFSGSFPRSGTKCYDMSHSNLTADFVGNPRFNYTIGGLINFDGGSNLSVGLLNPTNISIGAWVKTEDPETNGYILAKSDATGDIPWVLSIGGGTNSPNSDGMSIYSGAWINSGTNTDVRDGLWHYVMGTYDGTNMRYYVDGVLDASTTEGNGPLASTGSKFFIGLLNRTSEYFTGDIVMAHIYDRALSSNEVLHNYNNTSIRFNYNYTPDAVDWLDIASDYAAPSYTYTTQRIIGIDTSIYISPQYSPAADGKIFYNIDPSLVTFNGSLSPSLQGFTQIDSQATFTVPGGSFVTFGCDGTTPDTFEVTVSNSSAGGIVLDQFNVTIS